MTLTPNELHLVNERMKKYAILYQEIYDELTDHVITAIETAKANNDNRNIETIFDEVIYNQFDGKKGIAKIALRYAIAYNLKIKKAMIGNFKHYLNGQSVLLIAMLIITGFYLPRVNATSYILMFCLLIAAAIPQFYVMAKLPKRKKGIKKQSILRSFVVSRSGRLMIIFNLNICVIRILAKKWDIDFLKPERYHPAFYMLLLAFFTVYGLSCIRLFRQSFKIAE